MRRHGVGAAGRVGASERAREVVHHQRRGDADPATIGDLIAGVATARVALGVPVVAAGRGRCRALDRRGIELARVDVDIARSLELTGDETGHRADHHSSNLSDTHASTIAEPTCVR
jgi:hypothetical protein